MVVCKNMNATDVENLVPQLSLPGCRKGRRPWENKAGGGDDGIKGRCIEVLPDADLTSTTTTKRPRLRLRPTSKIPTKPEDSNCRGEAELCRRFNHGCKVGDVTCKLMHKVRNYLNEHYPKQKPPRLPTSFKTKKVKFATRKRKKRHADILF